MDDHRETRFDSDVMMEAVRRLNDHKDETGTGNALVRQLGWSILQLAELADDELEQLTRLVDSADSRVVTAFVDGILLGGLCADITYERAVGLTCR